MDTENEVENIETFMDWQDEPQENVEDEENGMLFEDNSTTRRNSVEMNPNLGFNPKLVIVIDTNILITDLQFVEYMKERPFDEFPAKFIVPNIVLEELDGLKNKTETRLRVEDAISMINFDLLNNHPRIVIQNKYYRALLRFRTFTYRDELVIACCLEQKKAGYDVILFTASINLSSKAFLNGIDSVGVSELRTLFPDIRKCSQFVNSKPHTIVSPQSSFGRRHVGKNKHIIMSDVIPEQSTRVSTHVTETSQNRTGSQFVNSKPHTIVSPQSSFGRRHVRKTKCIIMSDVIPEKSRRVSTHVTETSQNRIVCQTTESIKIPEKSKIKKVKISKKVLLNPIKLVSKLKQALQSFLTGVLKIDDGNEQNAIINFGLHHLETIWTEVTNLPLLVEDILAIGALKKLERPVEDISWSVNSVNELMNAANTIAGRFQKREMHTNVTTPFTLCLKECQDIQRRLKQEIITNEETIFSQEKETEIYIAGAAFSVTLEYVSSVCESLPSLLNSKETDPRNTSSIPVSQNSKDKSNGSNALERLNYKEEPCKLNTTKPESKNLPSLLDDNYIDNLSVVYKNTSDMLKGFEGLLKENLRTLNLTHPSIQLLYTTMSVMFPGSLPLPSHNPNSQSVYCMDDLTPKCILEYCSQEDKRASLENAKDSFSDFLFSIVRFYDDYFDYKHKKKYDKSGIQ